MCRASSKVICRPLKRARVSPTASTEATARPAATSPGVATSPGPPGPFVRSTRVASRSVSWGRITRERSAIAWSRFPMCRGFRVQMSPMAFFRPKETPVEKWALA